MISQENIYNLLQARNWSELIDIFYSRKDLIKNDTLLSQAVEVTLNEITQICLKLDTTPEFIENLEQLILLNAGKFISLKNEQEEAIISALVNGTKDKNLLYSYQYATRFPDNEICSKVITQFEKDKPKEINHSQDREVLLTENRQIEKDNDFRVSLFNSFQEVEFYLALKRVFDTYQVYPNVGLSTVIDFEKIREHLNQTEINFFFKSSIDFVVFEPFRNYLPIHFFEIDSTWHDTEEQEKKDKIKDKIFSISGQKLYRIRKINNKIDEIEFEKLIREIREEIKD